MGKAQFINMILVCCGNAYCLGGQMGGGVKLLKGRTGRSEVKERSWSAVCKCCNRGMYQEEVLVTHLL